MIKHNSRRFHIIIDSYNCNPKILMDKKKIDETLRNIAKLLEMNILHGPVIIDGAPHNPGLTAFTVIDFSHISIHTFTEAKEVCIDIFSCKSFNYEAVKKYVKEAFELKDEYTKYVEVKYD